MVDEAGRLKRPSFLLREEKIRHVGEEPRISSEYIINDSLISSGINVI